MTDTEYRKHDVLGYIHPGPPGADLAEPCPPLSVGFIGMVDPEGNEFCLD